MKSSVYRGRGDCKPCNMPKAKDDCVPCVKDECKLDCPDACDKCQKFMKRYMCTRNDYIKRYPFDCLAVAGMGDLDGDDPIDELILDDPDFCCYKALLGFEQCDIDQEIKNVVDWLKKQYDLDFSSVEYSDGNWALDGVVLRPYYVSPKMGLRPVIDYNGKVHGRVHECGLMAVVTRDLTVFGKYGGEEGKTIEARSYMNFGYWGIHYGNPDEHEVHRLIHFRADRPLKVCGDNFWPISHKVYESRSCDDPGCWGYASGCAGTFEDCRCTHVVSNFLVTFDSVPDCGDECCYESSSEDE